MAEVKPASFTARAHLASSRGHAGSARGSRGRGTLGKWPGEGLQELLGHTPWTTATFPTQSQVSLVALKAQDTVLPISSFLLPPTSQGPPLASPHPQYPLPEAVGLLCVSLVHPAAMVPLVPMMPVQRHQVPFQETTKSSWPLPPGQTPLPSPWDAPQGRGQTCCSRSVS